MLVDFWSKGPKYQRPMLWAILVLFAVRELHMSAGLIGLALAIGNLGFLLGAIGARRIADRIGIGPAIIVSAAVFGPVNVLVPLATPSTGFAILVITSFVGGFFGMVNRSQEDRFVRRICYSLRLWIC